MDGADTMRGIRRPAAAARAGSAARLALPLVMALAWTAPVASGQSPTDDGAAPAQRLSDAGEARARALEGRLKCPVCRTQSVLESTSFMALEMRAKIRELIAAGRSDGEILDYFADRYGDYILLEPRKRGFALSAYALPAAAVLLGAAGILAALVRRRALPGRSNANGAGGSAGDGRGPGPDRLSEADRARVEHELERYTV
jgi:cytochrome c-type biogenesis protein CcmH